MPAHVSNVQQSNANCDRPRCLAWYRGIYRTNQTKAEEARLVFFRQSINFLFEREKPPHYDQPGEHADRRQRVPPYVVANSDHGNGKSARRSRSGQQSRLRGDRRHTCPGRRAGVCCSFPARRRNGGPRLNHSIQLFLGSLGRSTRGIGPDAAPCGRRRMAGARRGGAGGRKRNGLPGQTLRRPDTPVGMKTRTAPA